MGEDASRLFRVRRTLCELLSDRGYAISDEDLKMTKEGFISKFSDPPNREQMVMLAEKKDKSESLFVFFSSEARLGVKPIREYFNRMTEQKITRSILVVQGGITPYAMTVMKAFAGHKDTPMQMEQFQESELVVNITQHTLVPKHVLLSDDEKQALLKKYKLKPTQLPRIQQTDPVARYMGLEKGQVVQIQRSSETAGRYITYRLVV